jgi:hypothetical protein
MPLDAGQGFHYSPCIFAFYVSRMQDFEFSFNASRAPALFGSPKKSKAAQMQTSSPSASPARLLLARDTKMRSAFATISLGGQQQPSGKKMNGH